MKILIMFFSILLICILFIWLAGFFFINDFSVKNTSLNEYKKILLVFPHADDEVLGTAGLINNATKAGKTVILTILTKGEKGNPDAHMDIKLKAIRTNEAKTIANMLGVTKLIQEDFGDGKLNGKKEELTQYIAELLKAEKPDLVITYDESGLYGHPDHIIVAEIVTDVIKKKYKNIELWYTTYPKRVLSMVHLPEHMAKDPQFKNKRKYPSNKVFIGISLFKKIQAVYAYKSQYQSFRDGVPFKPIPLWFFYSMGWYEYFHKV